MFDDLCRLCGGTEDLLWIFDEKLSDANMTEIISVTSGVEITKTDLITQMVCSTCCQITIKMYKFRTTAIKNDKDLKARCAGYNISRLSQAANIKKEASAAILRPLSSPAPKSPLAEPTTNTKANAVESSINSSSSISSNGSITNSSPVPIIKKETVRKPTSVHPSIRDIKRKYPNIKLPQMSLRSHFGAYITLLTDEVEDWYKGRNLSTHAIEKLKKEAMEYCSSARDHSPIPKKGVDTESEASKRYEDKSFVVSSTSHNKRFKLDNEITANDINKVSVTSNSKSNPKSDGVVKSCENSASKSSANSKLIVTSQATTTTGSNSARISKSNIDDLLDGSSDTDSDRDADFHMDVDLDSSSDYEPENIKVKSHTFSTRSKINRIADTAVSIPQVTSTAEESKSITDTSVQRQIRPMMTDKDQSEQHKTGREKITLLKSLLHNDGHLKTNENQEISVGDSTVLTLKDVSKPLGDSTNEKSHTVYDQEVIVPSVPLSMPSPDEDANMFTTQSFLTNSGPPPSRYNIHTEEVDGRTVLVLSDSDEDEQRNTKSDSEDSVLLIDTAASTPSVRSCVSVATDNTHPISPNSETASNMPDFTLVSFKEKIQRLHTCKVCDSQHHTLKDLKHHQRRRHTRCPFCNKKFRNLAVRDEHVKYNCNINSKPPELKNVNLCLVRVDEDENIRRQYPDAFEQNCETNIENISEFAKEVLNGETIQDQEREANNVEVESVEDQMREPVSVEELEKQLEDFLKLGLNLSSTPDKAGHSAKPMSAGSSTDVICISDDEGEKGKKKHLKNVKASRIRINIVNSDILKNVNLHDSDVNVLKNILTDAKMRAALRDGGTVSTLSNNTIVDGSTCRVKIFKNLRKHLHQYKIPIEVKYSPTVSVEYKPARIPVTKKIIDLWYTMVPEDLKPTTREQPRSLLPSPQVSTVPTVLHQNPSSVIFQSCPTSQPNVVADTNPFSSSNSHAPVAISSLLPLNNDQQCVIAPSTNVVFTSVMNTGKEQTYTNKPIVLNCTRSISSSTTSNSYTKILLLGGPLIRSNNLNLPSTQGPLPIIQSVLSSPEVEQQSSNNGGVVNQSSATVRQSLVANAILPMSNTLVSVSIASSLNSPLESVSNSVLPINSSVSNTGTPVDSSGSTALVPVSNGLIPTSSSVDNALVPISNGLLPVQSIASSSVICRNSYVDNYLQQSMMSMQQSLNNTDLSVQQPLSNGVVTVDSSVQQSVSKVLISLPQSVNDVLLPTKSAISNTFEPVTSTLMSVGQNVHNQAEHAESGLLPAIRVKDLRELF